jgi:signal transduction histidine kinase/ActR/RegA family two-component response regulator
VKAWFARLPIRRKLIVLILAGSAAVAIIGGAVHLATAYVTARGQAQEDAETQAQLVVDNAVDGVRFKDAVYAREQMDMLRTTSGFRAACLYDPSQQLFVEELADGDAPCPAAAPEIGSRISGARLDVTRLAERDGVRATLYFRSDVSRVQSRIQQQAFVVLAVMLIAFGVATLLSARLQAFVSEPVAELSRTATAISKGGDYSNRPVRRTDDELGDLVDAFNRMLDRIESREADLSKANEDLRHEIAERKRVEQERAELLVREREANRLKDQFLATLSHELRTPLNAILGWTKLLRGKALPAASADQALEKVERNAMVQARLVEDLLEISRITTGKMRLDMREIDLVALATTAVDSIRPAAEARGVSLEAALSAIALHTVGDPDRLQQVIWNLLSNAVKFTPAGGRARIEINRRGEMDEIVVSDTGIGIEPTFLPNVFETFRQADASATRMHGGLGLGLSIVRNLVELHGGSVEAHSEGTDQGATFTVRLPVRVASRPSRAPVMARRFDAQALAGYRVLIVEDDPDTRQLIESALFAGGAIVFSAGSADEGLALWRREHPHALISDIAMPGRDGYSLMRELTAAPAADMPRVMIALSAYAGPQDYQRSIDAGFHRHLAKPVDPVSLVEIVRELLDATAPSASEIVP